MNRLPIFLLSLSLLTLTAGYFELKIFPAIKTKKRYYLIDASGSYRPYLKEAFPRIASYMLEDENNVEVIAFSDRAIRLRRDELKVYEGYEKVLGLNPDVTAIRKAMELVTAPDGNEIELILVSDGNIYDLSGLKEFISNKGYKLYSLLVEQEGFNDLKIIDYLPGKNSVTLSVASTSECHAEVKVGQLGMDDILTKQVRFRKGLTRFTLNVKKSGFYTVNIDPIDISDPFVENNVISVEVGTDHKVRTVLLSGNEGAGSFFQNVLGNSSVDTGYVEKRLYDLVILDNYRLNDVSEASLIKDMVYNGAALMVFGGPKGYFNGNYSIFNLQDALPCYVTPKEKQDLILIVDNSGSMQAKYKGRQKIKYFKDLAKSVAEFLSEDSLVTVLLFRDKPELVIKDQKLADVDFNDLNVNTRGATNIGDAIEFISHIYRREELLSRRVVLFSDMETIEDANKIGSAVKKLDNDVLVVVPGDKGKLYEKFSGIDDLNIKSVDENIFGNGSFDASTTDGVVFFDERLANGVEGLVFNRLNGLSLKANGRLLAKSGNYPLIIAGSYGSGRVVCSSFAVSGGWSEVNPGLSRLIGNIVLVMGLVEKEDLQIDYEYLNPDFMKVTLWYGCQKPVDVVSVEAFCPQLDRNVSFIRKGFYHFEAQVPVVNSDIIHFIIGGNKYALRFLYPDEYRRTMINVNLLSDFAEATGGGVITEHELAGMLTKGGIVFVPSLKTCLILTGIFFLMSVAAGFYR